MSAGVGEGDLLWTPSSERIDAAAVTQFLRWLDTRGVHLETYDDLWGWSVGDTDAFWMSLWDYVGIPAQTPPRAVRDDSKRGMHGRGWFPGATLNYAEQALRGPAARTAVYFQAEDRSRQLTLGVLRDEVAGVAAGLRRLGVKPGDRVAAYMPNIPETLVAFLATASIGAIWTVCSPDFGTSSVLERFQQVDPVVLLAVTGYSYNGEHKDRRSVVGELARLPSLKGCVLLDPTGHASGDAVAPNARWWTHEFASTTGQLTFEPLAFDHPLWIIYTSGTTGLPKSIVHSHGGVLLEHLKLLSLHLDVGEGDRFLWYSTTSWVVWNLLVGALLVGASPVLCDGSPTHPSLDRLWALADDVDVTALGLAPGLIEAIRRSGVEPRRDHDLRSVRTVGVTGAPLSPSAHVWLYEQINADVHVASISGGTDIATAFIGSTPTVPVYAGEIQRSCLGVDARCFDRNGSAVVDEVGELVVSQPLPSMPLGFWNDDGSRYDESYFDVFPGWWRHGDWVRHTSRGTWVVLGRSDATLNRGGIRMGSAEFYRVLDRLPAVADSLVFDTGGIGALPSQLVLLIVPGEGDALADAARQEIRQTLRSELSPRHVPDLILDIRRLPHTLNGKRMEVPVKQLFLGATPTAALDRSSVDDPGAVDDVVALANRWRSSHT